MSILNLALACLASLLAGAGITHLIKKAIEKRDKRIEWHAIERLENELKIKNVKYRAALEKLMDQAQQATDKQKEALALDRARLLDETERDVRDAIELIKSALDRREGLD